MILVYILMLYFGLSIYSIYFVKHKYYIEIDQERVKISKIDYLLLGLGIIPIAIFYYYYSWNAALYWVFGLCLVYQDEKRYMLSDLTSFLMIIIGGIESMFNMNLLNVTEGAALICLQLFLLQSYGTELYNAILRLRKREETRNKILGSGDIKIAVGAMFLANMEFKIGIIESLNIMLCVYMTSIVWILVERIITREKKAMIPYAKFILLGIFVYFYILKGRFLV